MTQMHLNDFLTHEDVQQYGPDLIDVTQRAAMHALAPTLQQIQQQNAELQRRLAIESRRRMDQEVERAVPNYRQVDADPRWHRWLLGIDSLSGRVRQQWLNDAIAAGDSNRVVMFFRSFLREHGSAAQTPAATQTTSTRSGVYGSRSNTSIGTRSYTPAQIRQIYERRRKGGYSDSKFAEIEADIFQAQHESRIVMNPYLTK